MTSVIMVKISRDLQEICANDTIFDPCAAKKCLLYPKILHRGNIFALSYAVTFIKAFYMKKNVFFN